MTRNSGSPARTAENADLSEIGYSSDSQSQRKNWRGAFALGLLFVTAVAGYGLVFVVIDKVYKGGGLGLL